MSINKESSRKICFETKPESSERKFHVRYGLAKVGPSCRWGDFTAGYSNTQAPKPAPLDGPSSVCLPKKTEAGRHLELGVKAGTKSAIRHNLHTH